VPNPPDGSETIRALERRVVWTAFYRRALYAADDPASPNYNPDAVGDPTLYEIIAVALRVPDRDQHFPAQHPDDGGTYIAGFAPMPQSGGQAPAPDGSDNFDVAAPMPWLVSFVDPLPAPPLFDATGTPVLAGGVTPVAVQPPPVLRFRCSPRRDPLFPVGTIFIPARNDVCPHALRGGGGAGTWVDFGPTTTSLPIFEVVARPDSTTVDVKYNGYFPRRCASGYYATPGGDEWPVWVIPPAARRDPSGSVLWNNQSPILAVARRFIRVPEVP
jgi:hypothetical protein